MVTDEGMREKAGLLSQKIRTEDGIANAIQPIEKHLDFVGQ